ncbi:hypothetical protein ACU4GA_29475 [Methylobacterium oryzae CBMB20]
MAVADRDNTDAEPVLDSWPGSLRAGSNTGRVTFLIAYTGQTGGSLMRIRYLLPLVGLLALSACKDEKKAENPAPPPPPRQHGAGKPCASGNDDKPGSSQQAVIEERSRWRVLLGLPSQQDPPIPTTAPAPLRS